MSHLRATLDRLGWSMPSFARMIGRPVDTVKNWQRPGYRVPSDVADWLERRVDWHEQAMRVDPPPMKET